MKADKLRQEFLEYFKKNKHEVIASASLIPDNDPTVLFTTAGMHPLVPFLMGEKHPCGTRLVNVQKCIRTGDIEEVGDTTHHTFFEMLGNWSLGDYDEEQAVKYSWEFIIKELKLDKNKIAISIFGGNDDVPKDTEAEKYWLEAGVAQDRITAVLDNFWGPAGQTGPCGPDTEIFYWTSSDPVPDKFDESDDRWVEIWNNVFMKYNKTNRTILIDGMFTLYDEKFNIDTKLLNIIEKYNTDKILVVNKSFDEANQKLEGKIKKTYSFEGKINKDSAEFFNKLLKDHNLEPDNVIYIDHAQENLDGAKKAGIKNTQLFKNNYEDIDKFISNNLYKFKELEQKNIDTGMGFERTLAVLNNLDDNYKTDLFWPIIEKIQKLSDQKYEDNTKAFRVITDHIRSAVFIIGDECTVTPSNTGAGYIVRRLIRRSVRFANQLDIQDNFTTQLAEVVIDIMKSAYPELDKNKDLIISELEKEENKFKQTLAKGLKEFAKQKNINGKTAFTLFSTYGFPLEMTEELAKENNIQINKQEFEAEFKKHQDLSRTASAGMFKGGLADDSAMTKKYHTATHLLLQALRDVLGNHVEQRGSNINDQRARFDFSHDNKLTDEEKQKIEDIINKQIKAGLEINCDEMTLEEAEKAGAIGLFKSKYGEKVKVYTMGDYSKEICGGPHTDNTSNLGTFKILKESSSSAGVRRIKAILE